MDFFTALTIGCLFGYACYSAGAFTKQNPTEEVMIQRLIQLRLGRQLARTSREDLLREVDAAVIKLSR